MSLKNKKNKKNTENFKNFSQEKKGETPERDPLKKEPISGAVLARRIAVFGLAFLFVFGGVTCGGNTLFPDYFPKCALLAGTIFLIVGIVYIAALYYLNGRYGILAEYAIGAGIRTGVPLTLALVIFLFLDNILFKYSVLTMVVFYLLLTPIEVWMSLPEQKKQSFGNPIKEKDASDEC